MASGLEQSNVSLWRSIFTTVLAVSYASISVKFIRITANHLKKDWQKKPKTKKKKDHHGIIADHLCFICLFFFSTPKYKYEDLDCKLYGFEKGAKIIWLRPILILDSDKAMAFGHEQSKVTLWRSISQMFWSFRMPLF